MVAFDQVVASPGVLEARLLGWVCGLDWRDGREWLYGHHGLASLHPDARPPIFRDKLSAWQFAHRQTTSYPIVIRRDYRVPLGRRVPHTGKTYLTDEAR
jgi:hypothetical protein